MNYGVEEGVGRKQEIAVIADIEHCFADSLAHAVEKALGSVPDYSLLNSACVFFSF